MWAWSFGLIVSFSMAIIGAGHGVLPLGLILVWGLAEPAVFEQVALGWIAVAVVLLGAPLTGRTSIPVLSIGAALLFADWCYFMSMTEALPAVLVLSAPYLACNGAFVLSKLRGLRRTAG